VQRVDRHYLAVPINYSQGTWSHQHHFWMPYGIFTARGAERKGLKSAAGDALPNQIEIHDKAYGRDCGLSTLLPEAYQDTALCKVAGTGWTWTRYSVAGLRVSSHPMA